MERGLRERLDDAMRKAAERKQQTVAANLKQREAADLARASEIFAAFRRNLTESLARLRTMEKEAGAMLFTLEDEKRQFQRDIRAMEDRLTELETEEARELASIRERYTDVRPFVSAAAVVFALDPADGTAAEVSA